MTALVATRRRLVVLLFALAVVGGVGIGVLARAVTGESAQGAPAHHHHDHASAKSSALPATHGQASWEPGTRAAPPVELRDQKGELISLAHLRGRPVLLTFLDSRCEDQCSITGHELGTMLRGIAPADRPTLLIVSVDPAGDTKASIQSAMTAWGLAGPWRWHWLRGTSAELAAVWDAYGITVEETTNDITHGLALYLIDRQGFQRAGYLFPFLPNFVSLDLQKLAREQA